MNFADIVAELISLDDPRALKLMLIAAMVVGPQETVSIFHILAYIFNKYAFMSRSKAIFRIFDFICSLF